MSNFSVFASVKAHDSSFVVSLALFGLESLLYTLMLTLRTTISLLLAQWQASGAVSSTSPASEAQFPSEDAKGFGSFRMEISA